MKRLQDRLAIVTGAGAGIGHAIARRLSDEGAHLVLWDINDDALAMVANELSQSGRAFAMKVDVSVPSDIEQGMARVREQFGVPTILVNNAAVLRLAPAINTTNELFDDVVATNLRSVFVACREFARAALAECVTGSIVNISSIHAVISEPSAVAYTAAKGGVEAMSRTLASEWAVHGIRVNCVRPGATRTELTRALYTPEVLASLSLRVPLRRVAEPTEIAAGVAFLASDDSSYCTGTTLDIDGGYIMDGSLPGLVYE
jgi:NAD(P)-dependent dehydrogenase (short-subunit alcohol dehydrogenase family)